MDNYENTVAENMMFDETPSDDAQAAEISAEELFGNLTSEQTAENNGDGDQQQGGTNEQQSENDKFSRRIKSALANQAKQYEGDRNFAGRLRGIASGMTDDEIVAALTEHQARKMHEEAPDKYSTEAAKEIIETRSRVPQVSEIQQSIMDGFNALRADGWTDEEMRAFSLDEAAQKMIADGKGFDRAVNAYLRSSRNQQSATAKKGGVPTVKSATTRQAVSHSRIEDMTSEQFREFNLRAKEAAMAGRRVKIE